jgi:hypothetical protein
MLACVGSWLNNSALNYVFENILDKKFKKAKNLPKAEM